MLSVLVNMCPTFEQSPELDIKPTPYRTAPQTFFTLIRAPQTLRLRHRWWQLNANSIAVAAL